ncbi:MAG: TonB-dependent receptor plug domain-containing protein [Opitutaceae bacterium]|nr:TonB-dependent receptor plug domain-containing protein [Opitutaceae bacterium]
MSPSLAPRPSAALLSRLLLPSLLLATAARLYAQVPAPAVVEDKTIELSPFTVSTESGDRYHSADAISAVRVRAPLLETASTISVVTREMMDDLAPNRVFDVTRYIAGVQEGRGVQFQDRMIIRGFETQGGARTVDNFLQSADADNIDESVVDRIEVSKGPNAILSPAGAPGGSLNIITKSPSFRRKHLLTAQIGLFDSQKALLDMTGPIRGSEQFAYRMVASIQDTRRYWSSEADLRGRALAPMLSWKISDRTTLTMKLVASEHWIFREPLLIIDPSVTAATDKPFLAPRLAPKSLNGIQPWSHVGTHSADFFSVLTTNLNEHINLRFAGNGRYYFEDSEQNFLSTPGLSNRYHPRTGELTQDYTWAIMGGVPVSTFSPFFDPANIPNRGDIQATRRKTANLQADAVASYRFGEVSSQTVTGLGYSRQTGYGRGRNGVMPGIDLSNPDRRSTPVYGSTFSFYNANTYTNVQAYLNQRLGFLQDRLYVTAGLMHYDTRTTGRNVLTGAAPSVLDDAKDMWSASVLYKVRDNAALYYSRSKNASPVIANNLPLWREGVQDELGFKTAFFERKLSLNGSYFEISQTNVTVPNPAYQTDQTVPQTLVSDLNNHGFEVELMGSLSPDLSVIATYSQLKMRDSLGRKVRGVADNNASLLVNYRFKEGTFKDLAIHAGVSYSGRRAGDVPDGNFTALGVVKQVSFYLEPQYVTTLGFNYRWSQALLTRLTIDNVLDDKDYIAVAGGRVAGTGITTAPGRNLRLSTTFQF